MMNSNMGRAAQGAYQGYNGGGQQYGDENQGYTENQS